MQEAKTTTDNIKRSSKLEDNLSDKKDLKTYYKATIIKAE